MGTSAATGIPGARWSPCTHQVKARIRGPLAGHAPWLLPAFADLPLPAQRLPITVGQSPAALYENLLSSQPFISARAPRNAGAESVKNRADSAKDRPSASGDNIL